MRHTPTQGSTADDLLRPFAWGFLIAGVVMAGLIVRAVATSRPTAQPAPVLRSSSHHGFRHGGVAYLLIYDKGTRPDELVAAFEPALPGDNQGLLAGMRAFSDAGYGKQFIRIQPRLFLVRREGVDLIGVHDEQLDYLFLPVRDEEKGIITGMRTWPERRRA